MIILPVTVIWDDEDDKIDRIKVRYRAPFIADEDLFDSVVCES